jgi:hypothetical protein
VASQNAELVASVETLAARIELLAKDMHNVQSDVFIGLENLRDRNDNIYGFRGLVRDLASVKGDLAFIKGDLSRIIEILGNIDDLLSATRRVDYPARAGTEITATYQGVPNDRQPAPEPAHPGEAADQAAPTALAAA